MRTIRFRISGSDNRSDWFGAPIADAVKSALTNAGWLVTSPIATTRPNGWTGLSSLVFDFTVSVYDSYADNYATNELVIKEQARRDLAPVLDINWIVMLSPGDAVADDTGGFIFDSTNTQAIKDVAPDIPSLSVGFFLVLGAAFLIFTRK